MLLFKPVRTVSLKHGWFYHYRVHDARIDALAGNGFSKLKDYIDLTFKYCPQKPFDEGGRASSMKVPVSLDMVEKQGDLCQLTMDGLIANKDAFKQNHSRVQVHFLDKDPATLACELPLWMLKNEMNGQAEGIDESLFPMSGHVDVLRIHDGKINILDYKPRAHKEKYAATQLYIYALMLSKRTGIPIEKMSCAYFDENVEYWFEPKDCMLANSSASL